jgi:murein DD-endopeptidase MepM/ murein hydrolase activator NlpD
VRGLRRFEPSALLLGCTLVVAAVLTAGLLAGSPVGASTGEARTYQPPTAGAVVDPFRPPPEPWLPGNRGIEYATAPGSALVAIGPGVVAFAGPVAGRLVLTVVHPDGLRSSLTGVAVVLVGRGDVVEGGQLVARAGPSVHLGVRRGERYLDPELLWGRPVHGGRAVLVPHEPEGRGPSVPGAAPAREGSPRRPSPGAAPGLDLAATIRAWPW